MSPLHKLGQMRDKPADDYRPVLFMLRTDVANQLDEEVARGGLAATADARDDIADKAFREYFAGRNRGAAS